MPDHHPAPPQAASVGALVELSRYRVATGERVLRGQRILGGLALVDEGFAREVLRALKIVG